MDLRVFACWRALASPKQRRRFVEEASRGIQEAFQDKPQYLKESVSLELQVKTQEYCKKTSLRAPLVENAAGSGV